MGVQNELYLDSVDRVEVRAGKKHLKDRYGIITFEDLEHSFGDVVKRALEDVRYLDDDQDYDTVNVSRARLHPLWQAVRAAALQALCESCSGLCAGAIKKYFRNEHLKISQQGIFAYARRYAVSLGLSDEQIIEILPQIVADTLAFEIANDQERFLEKTYKSQQKVLFLEDDHFDIGKYQVRLCKK